MFPGENASFFPLLLHPSFGAAMHHSLDETYAEEARRHSDRGSRLSHAQRFPADHRSWAPVEHSPLPLRPLLQSQSAPYIRARRPCHRRTPSHANTPSLLQDDSTTSAVEHSQQMSQEYRLKSL